MLWEIWAAHRVGFAVLAAAVPICALGARLLASSPEQNELWAEVARVPFGFSVVAAFLFFNFSETNRELNLTGFPVRMFAMPVKTLAMAAVPMVSGAVFVAVLHVLWARLVFSALEPAAPVWGPELLLATGMMSYLAVMWGFPRLRLGRLFLSGAIGVVLLWGLVFPDALMPAGLVLASPMVQWAVGGSALCLISLAAFGWAWISLIKQRHVRTRAKGVKVGARVTLSDGARPRPPFTSPAAAQLWLEWRRHGWLLPAAVLIFGILATGPVPLSMDLDPANSLKLAGCLLLLPIALAMMLGKALAVPDFWSRDLGLPPFLAVQPRSCWSMISARFRIAAVSAGLSWLVMAGCLLVFLRLWGDNSLLREYWRDFRLSHSAPIQCVILLLGVSSLFLLTWRQLIVSAYLGLAGRAGIFGVAVVSSFALYFVGWPWLASTAWSQGFPYSEPAVPWRFLIGTVTVAFVLKMYLASWTWSTLRRRELLSARQALKYWLAWGIATASLVTFAELAIPGFDWVRHGGAMVCLLAVPLGRPGLAVLALDANRHRVTSGGRSGTAARARQVLTGRGQAQPAAVVGWLGLISPARNIVSMVVPASGLSLAVVVAAALVWDRVPHLESAGDCRLRLLQIGKGSPTVVLESDLLGLIERWWPVQKSLATEARVVAYERTGRGGSERGASAASARIAVQQLHAALANAGAPPPYLLVGDGVGGALVRVFANLFPKDVAGIVLLDPPQIETSTEALDWLRAMRPEQMPGIEEWLKRYPRGLWGFGLREFKRAEQKLEKLRPEDRPAARPALWDDISDGTLYAMAIQLSQMAPGSRDEFSSMDNIILEDRAAWPPPNVPITVLTGLKRGVYTSVERDSVDEDQAERKLSQHRQWVSRIPGAKLVVSLESGGSFVVDQPDLVTQTVHSMLQQIRTADRSLRATTAKGSAE